jgi:two-component system, cell cycle sensor histidine kinase and response regulator CckA
MDAEWESMSDDNVKPNTDEDNKKPLARLLVVDDDPDIVYVLKHGLLSYGFLVDAFTNPEEVLQTFKSNPEGYPLVLADSWMPSISGTQLAEKVKEVNPNVKVLLLTGSEVRDLEFSKVSHSTNDIVVDGFIQKPVGIGKLTDRILSLLDETKGWTSFKDEP